jgi:AcrR family transcriptional regulator
MASPRRPPPRKPPAGRTRRAGATPLSRERIVRAALALVDRDGLEGFSTRNLGRALGCEAMSIYHFFPSKQHLVDALVDEAIASIEFPDGRLPAVERLRRVCHAYRAMAHRHARLFPLVAVHRLNTETGVRFIEKVLAITREAAGDDERAARFFRALGYFLMGTGLDETSGYAKGPSAAQPVANEFIGRECPQLVKSAKYFQRDAWDTTFELGLEAMLRGLDSPPKAKGRSAR